MRVYVRVPLCWEAAILKIPYESTYIHFPLCLRHLKDDAVHVKNLQL